MKTRRGRKKIKISTCFTHISIFYSRGIFCPFLRNNYTYFMPLTDPKLRSLSGHQYLRPLSACKPTGRYTENHSFENSPTREITLTHPFLYIQKGRIFPLLHNYRLHLPSVADKWFRQTFAYIGYSEFKMALACWFVSLLYDILPTVSEDASTRCLWARKYMK